MTQNSQGIVDSLDFSSVLNSARTDEPKLTFTLPTDVTGADAKLSALTLKNQLREAQTLLEARGLGPVEARALLDPVTALVEDSSFWRLQSRGLVVFAARGFHHVVRVPIQLQESLTIGERFNLLPLAPVLASDRKCYVLALAKNTVRLFDSTRNTIEELPLENIPASFDEVIEELPEKEVDMRAGAGAQGGAPISHGTGGNIDLMLLEKYIHAVGQAVGERLGTARSQPLVLAAVAEYLPIFKAACPYPAIFDGIVAGNPEHTLPDDLRSAAWKLLNDSETANEAEEEDRARSLAHNGRGAFDLAEIAKAAEEGRVATLFLPRDDLQIAADDTRALANRALIDTLNNSGVLRTLGVIDGEALATLRY